MKSNLPYSTKDGTADVISWISRQHSFNDMYILYIIFIIKKNKKGHKTCPTYCFNFAESLCFDLSRLKKMNNMVED